MDIKVWPINDSIQCQQLTAEYLEETLDLIDISFFRYENVSTVLEIAKDPEALRELRQLTLAAAKDGVTVIAIDKTKNKVVGAALNKLQVRDNPAFEIIAQSWKNPKSKAIVQLMADIDNLCNLFDHCKTDAILELMFLTTLPEYGGKGIGVKLTEATQDIGRSLLKGINVKKPIDGQKLSLEPAPKIVSAIFTTFVTQKIGRKLDWTIVAEKNFADYEFEGRNFGKIIGKETPTVTLEYKSLQ
ncbi:uncharacterized protein LOC660825 [Tribolium castaneum]|uniref:Dopamine N-acetyltransferase-like Protein n=1 Tax=Tribolium castaneum TaxID=7070 RepID=D6WLP0_TRICA|nr:PREDICTED: uncharacterized protein LOC660825 [Tribolium castaneum]EFA04145.1 Dopamine N-acetyltransferase-like Protein [Tribolium castaneum]|eukprot:XP_972121.1 PREDICTED: uncharacterized protein LOC660825 [Tribolium castaneum]